MVQRPTLPLLASDCVQEERKKAREEKAKHLAEGEDGGQAVANGTVGDQSGQADKLTKPAPVILGTKGSFQEVLARRQAELAALKSKNAAGPSRNGPGTRSGRKSSTGHSSSCFHACLPELNINYNFHFCLFLRQSRINACLTVIDCDFCICWLLFYTMT